MTFHAVSQSLFFRAKKYAFGRTIILGYPEYELCFVRVLTIDACGQALNNQQLLIDGGMCLNIVFDQTTCPKNKERIRQTR